MNLETRVRSNWILFTAIILLAVAGLQVHAQSATPQNPIEQPQTQTQASQTPDFAQLNLSPDQIQKIRAINLELKDQRQAAGMKLRQAQRALAESVESPTPNETLIDQRSRELAEAQATTIRLRSLAESRILQVMTPEQRIRLREMRRQNQALRRQANQQQLPGRGLGQRRQGLQRNPNAAPAQPGQRKLQRQAPKR
jgi:Spy/CpxP family protein refolding chaperone